MPRTGRLAGEILDAMQGTCELLDYGDPKRPYSAALAAQARKLDDAAATPSARLLKELADAIGVLHVGWVNDNAQEEAQRVDEDVALAPRDLLARIIALRVERGAPF